MKAPRTRRAPRRSGEPTARDRMGFVATLDAKVLDEIGDAAAYTPKRQRAAFAAMLRGIGGVLAGRPPPEPDPRIAEIDVRVRRAVMTVFSRYGDFLALQSPKAVERLAGMVEIAAELADEGQIPMGTKRLPRVATGG